MNKKTKTLLAGTMGAAGLLMASTQAVSANTTVKVHHGDTVWNFAQKYGVSIKSIETLNKISSQSHMIFADQDLQIPSQHETAKPSSNVKANTYVVKAGDTLWDIAQAHHMSVDQLREMNHIDGNSDLIQVGQVLQVAAASKVNTKAAAVKKAAPSIAAHHTAAASSSVSAASSSTSRKSLAPKVVSSGSAVAAKKSVASVVKSNNSVVSSAAKTSESTKHVDHTVKAGESLYTVAHKYGVSVKSLRSSNPSVASSLTVGKKLVVNNPSKQAKASSAETKAVSSSSVKQAASSSSVKAVSSSSQAQTSSKTAAVSSSAKQTAASTSAVSSSAKAASATSSYAAPQASEGSANTASSSTYASSTSQASQQTASVKKSAAPKATTYKAAASSQAQTSGTVQVKTSNGSIVTIAKKYLGTPYVWGGTSPKGFDCSGFTQYVYNQAGKKIGRNTVAQESAGTQIPVSQAQAGDLLFWGNKGSSYHVAISTGGNGYIAAPQPGQNVKYGSTTYYKPTFAVHVK